MCTFASKGTATVKMVKGCRRARTGKKTNAADEESVLDAQVRREVN